MAAIAQLAPTHMVGSMAIFHRIYIGSIQFDITEADLMLLFGQFGPIQNISMIQDPVQRRHRGYGFIEFETPEAAALAQAQMDSAELGGRTIKVGRPNNFPADLPAGIPRPLEERIYIANVHELVQEAELRLVCEAFGPVRGCHLVPNLKTRKHRGYAFVEYETLSAARNALSSLNNFELAKKLLKVGRTISGGPMPAGMESIDLESAPSPRPEFPPEVLQAAQEIDERLRSPPSTLLILRNLEDYANLLDAEARSELETDVADECANFGAVQVCRVSLDTVNQTVTVYVKFSAVSEMEAAVKAMHHRWFAGRQIIAEAAPEEQLRNIILETRS